MGLRARKTTGEAGFVLIVMFFTLVLIAVTALALNRRAGMQSRMAANSTLSVQTEAGQLAAVEDAVWQLTQSPAWRTAAGGESFAYNGVTYNRRVLNSTVAGHTDAVTVSVTAPGAAAPVRASVRYYLDDLFAVLQPYQVCRDAWNNLYFADSGNHAIIKVNSVTGAASRVAGNGTSGFSGDGGPAIQAQLRTPAGGLGGQPGRDLHRRHGQRL